MNLESFREMLHICPRIPGQAFAELHFKEEILEFIWFLRHAIINKCLTGKSSGYDSFRLSQAQILWGLYHTRSIDYDFLIWEDFVYQVEHKNQKKSNEMYYPRFTKVVSRHQNTQQYGVMLPIKLTNDEIRNTKAYKEYYAFAIGEAAPKLKASARRKRSGSDTSITPPTATTTPTTTIAVTSKLTAAAKGKQPAKAKNEGTGSKPGVPDVPTDESEEELSWNSSNDEGADDQEKVSDDEEGDEGESDEEDDNEETRDEESFDPIPQTPKSSEDEGDGEEDQVILKRRRDDDDDQEEGPSAGSDRGSKRQREGREPESTSAPLETATRRACRSTTGSKSQQVSVSTDDQPIVQSSQPPEWFSQPKKPPTPDRDWNKTLPAIQGSTQTWISELAKKADSRSSFNELLDTPLDFSNFIMNRLRVDTLTHELLVGPTFELMKGSCTSLIELEYHLEEVYKATTDQLDWVNPEGQQYPHNMLQPLSLISDNRGRRVIPFAHFINNDLEYLRGGRKRQQFYGFAVNWESALDVYSKRRIIAGTDLKIVEWHSYKHLDWITVRRDDDKLYKFKEGNFKRLRLQDIEDMLLFLVQGKLSNLTGEERFAFNVSLRMFTRSIVIQRRVKDLQLGVKSYQKRLNLTKPDTYRSDLKRREAYTAYSNPRGFIYQNKDKKNRLMQIDELHKFNDGMLNDIRNALDDRLKGIRMQYLPQTIWRKGDKDRAAAMIQAIDKMLKTRRIMRSLEKFVGGRLYEGDFRMLQRTI
nr:hypothetical protein [Tanacetum cinerariifolium]